MKRSKTAYWIFVLPTLIPFLYSLIVPAILGIAYSFTDWNGMRKEMSWVGFSNYTKILTDQQFGHSLVFTVTFALVCVVLINLFGFMLALFVTRGYRGSNVLRGIFFMPNLIGGVLLGFTFQFIFIQVFNSYGTSMGIQWLRNWLSTETTGFWGLVIMLVWQSSGYDMLIYIAQLQTIPEELVQAAMVDGANSRQVLMKITLPLLRPAFTTCVFMTLSFCLKIFDFNVALTNGNPARLTEMISLNIYKEAYTYNNMGYAQAKALIYLVLVAVITLTQLYLFRKREIEM